MEASTPAPSLSREQHHVADHCLHQLLQCIYAAPVLAYAERDKHMKTCHFTAAHCYQHMMQIKK